MSAFWILAAVLAALGLAFVLRPLLRAGVRGGGDVSQEAVNIDIYRDQLSELEADLASGTMGPEQYARAKADIERRVLEESGRPAAAPAAPAAARRLAAALALALPLAAFSIYLLLGTPRGLDPEAVKPPVEESHPLSADQIGGMVDKLAARLKEEPDNVDGWVMLGRSYGVLRRYREAAQAYGQASALRPGDAQLMADHADALAMAQGRSLEGEPERVIAKALQIDPANLKVRLLAGTVAFQKRDFAGAVAHWRAALENLPEGSQEMAASIRASIAEAQANSGTAAPPAPARAPASVEAAAAATSTSGISGTVRLSAELAGRAAPEDVVFIFARSAEGPRMPVAILRKQVKDLPLQFRLDDTMAMSPGATLSAAGRLVVGARVSKTGNAIPRPGDLEGLSAPVAANATGLVLTIDKVVQ
ncbi:MAG: c-type cytochrome biogenesis protein CcmI [Rhodocyclaceae bacterium]